MASPPLYDDYSPSSSQERSDREITDEHKYKRRRITSEVSPQHPTMPEAPRPANIPLPARFAFQPGYTVSSGDSFPQMPADIPSLWEDQQPFGYQVLGGVYPAEIRGMTTMPPAYPPNIPTPAQPAHDAPHTSNPARDYDRRTPPNLMANPHRFHNDIWRNFPGYSEQQIRDFVSRMPEGSGFFFDPTVPGNPIPPDPSRVAHTSNASTEGISSHRRSAPTMPGVPPKPATRLVLSRATTESVQALGEHKKECPACQLEFEPDNYMAVISCCDTAMHATCLSAWVNSQTYTKSRACMKCRRGIDARRTLNGVVAPVSDQSWDDGVDLNAPESLKADSKIELNVTARPDRAAYRRARDTMFLGGYGSRQPLLGHSGEISEEARQSINRVKQEQLLESDALKRKVRETYEDRNRVLDDDVVANRLFSEAQVAVARGDSIDLEPLSRRCQETRLAKEKAFESFKKSQREMEHTARVHSQRLRTMYEEAYLARVHATEEAALRNMTSSGQTGGRTSSMSTSP
ncbi:hypothetical protein LTR10_021612 [Elasticomyces elasticus]|uniref:RING-type domain-containing protein n=1 Tax=Exophiala sideris TaxID=1016849 RepID=A0ABR0J2S7_9EURO|nr:hypothetical protein LTR10_021612 [Elasticomyces elasticus]KAK5024144.1 hypothetical protein LTS07_008879 [Exophiala sideris]KAK5028996.1 hypothetical protein LTR13_008866 [Exophiala sideris]KAK5054856.1 hypothetical protein LTR69_008764 [Exophiala sideris]KAK5178819.1 hypothetical protein LTR44_008647 [Eurotiomycetes sp. CCFEE 6388]